MRQIIVVGGGAAGMMAAVAAAEAGAAVTLLEKNEKLGKKIYITGKGRCNLTNAAPMREVQAQVVSNPRFLYSAFRAMTNEDVMQFFERAGCPLKTERGERVFPVSDHASDVIRALEREMQAKGVRVRLNTEVRELLFSGDSEERRVTGVTLSNGEKLRADAVILATGGISYPATGSTGDGYRFSEAAGMKVTERHPSLVPLILKEQESCAAMQGLSLKNVTITLKDGKKKVYEGFGEALFTHFGMSGPLLLSASALAGPLLRSKQELELRIDLKPALTEEQLEQRLLREFDENKNKSLKNILPSLFPQSLIPEVLRQSGVSGEKKVRDITKSERAALRQATKGLRFTATGLRGFNEAVVTKGGVSVREVSPNTMESKTAKGLYLAGEVLDLDAMTGGFNLQIAWSTGRLAGQSAGAPKAE
nr:NAD(P)/FAD-dependent oxidoreductase [uncultured Stomatobaculum sp.]